MCSRYGLTLPPEAVRSYFGLPSIDPFPPRYNIAPTQPVAIVRLDQKGQREAALVRWGLIPSWVKDPREFATLINARAETASEKPSFRAALRHRRCLVPATGYYEWTGRPGAKVAHLLRPATGEFFAFAGLWEHWIGADGSEIETMAILTAPANATVKPVHDRMPVLVEPLEFARWLDCRSGSAVGITDLLGSPHDNAIVGTAIGSAINSVQVEGASLWEPKPENLP